MASIVLYLGIALVILGTIVWLYGDYGGGPQYVWPGVVAILLGTLIWAYDDYRNNMFGARAGKR